MDDLFDATIKVSEVTAYKLTLPDGSVVWTDSKGQIKQHVTDYATKSGKSMIMV